LQEFVQISGVEFAASERRLAQHPPEEGQRCPDADTSVFAEGPQCAIASSRAAAPDDEFEDQRIVMRSRSRRRVRRRCHRAPGPSGPQAERRPRAEGTRQSGLP
jgi:hypothetical protein